MKYQYLVSRSKPIYYTSMYLSVLEICHLKSSVSFPVSGAGLTRSHYHNTS